MAKLPQFLNLSTIQSSMNLYRRLIRLSNEFPKPLHNKIRFNIREAYALNKVFLDTGSFNQRNVKSLIDKSDHLYHSLSSLLRTNKPLFLELFGNHINSGNGNNNNNNNNSNNDIQLKSK